MSRNLPLSQLKRRNLLLQSVLQDWPKMFEPLSRSSYNHPFEKYTSHYLGTKLSFLSKPDLFVYFRSSKDKNKSQFEYKSKKLGWWSTWDSNLTPQERFHCTADHLFGFYQTSKYVDNLAMQLTEPWWSPQKYLVF